MTLRVNADISLEKEIITKEITKRAEEYKNKEMGQDTDIRYSPTRKQVSKYSPGKSSMAGVLNAKSYGQSGISGYM